jgi:hypothetical protein
MTEPIDLDTLRCAARLAGFEWSDAELEAMRPMVEASLRQLSALETLPLEGVEPATQYRML